MIEQYIENQDKEPPDEDRASVASKYMTGHMALDELKSTGLSAGM